MEDSERIDQDYILNLESLNDSAIKFKGEMNRSNLVYDKLDAYWRVLSLKKGSVGLTLAFYNDTKRFPIGLLDWFAVGICSDYPNETYSLPLKLSKVSNQVLGKSWSHQ